ncbi:MAG: hypothetical protein JJ896_03425 [Rhodothermales bacterium]|nr:hypothetical protein [Rhodothermales bacterium]MBO6778685.1 hypothetical protein [Rhodothermales bacterium]
MNSVTLRRSCRQFDDQLFPVNQRNLTDVRTRVGTLLEYEFAYAATIVLEEAGVADVTCTLVVANRYPDLAFRSDDGELGVRIEVKTVEVVAEERAANFDTALKDIRKGCDVVLIMTWRWSRDEEVPNARFPEVVDWFVFDAYALAQFRDCAWLNSPPASASHAQGRLQGLDYRTAIHVTATGYKYEEGNLGKVSRFLTGKDSWIPERVRETGVEETYDRFLTSCLSTGAESLLMAFDGFTVTRLSAAGQLPATFKASSPEVSAIVRVDSQFKNNAGLRRNLVAAAVEHSCDYIILLNRSYAWRAWETEELRQGRRQYVDEGRKPHQLLSLLSQPSRSVD